MPTDPPAAIGTTLLLAAVFAWSGLCVRYALRRLRRGRPLLPRRPAGPPPSPLAVAIAVAVLLPFGLARFAAPEEPAELELSARSVLVLAATNLLFAGLLQLFRVFPATTGSPRALPPRVALRDAVFLYGLVVPPTALLLIALIPFRDPENANALLRLLADEAGPVTLAAVAASAVIAAPLFEEMTFRVVLQPALARLLGEPAAIAAVALLFAAVHGPYDAVPLLPLAAALGWLYATRRSVLAVVALHALFNAVFLAFALLTAT